MADDREPCEPLWATGLARGARLPDPEPEPSPPPKDPFPVRFAAVMIAAAVAVVVVAALLGRGSAEITVADLPSAWGDIPMTCDTTRIKGDDRTVELFRCRATEGGLPPGEYDSPDTLWSSDVDRRPAISHRISISRSGQLTGSALYIP